MLFDTNSCGGNSAVIKSRVGSTNLTHWFGLCVQLRNVFYLLSIYTYISKFIHVIVFYKFIDNEKLIK